MNQRHPAPEDRPTVPPATDAGAAVPRRSPWVYWLVLAALALATITFFAAGGRQYLSVERFLQSRDSLAAYTAAHPAVSLLAYAGIYIAAVALSVPGATLLTVAGGFLFGAWLGSAAAVLSATTGAVLLFLVARYSLGEALAARMGSKIARLREGFARDAASYMLFLRLAPIFPFWLVNLAPALLGVPLSTFAWTTFVGVIPATVAFSLAGAGLDSVLAAQNAAYKACLAAGEATCKQDFSPKSLATREVILGLAALGVMALLPALIRRWRARTTGTE